MRENLKNFETDEKLTLEELSELKNRFVQMSADEILEFLSLVAKRTFEQTGEGFNQEMIDERTCDESKKDDIIREAINKTAQELLEEKSSKK
ncbi:MAG: hypothetical protein WBD99_02535 [Thermodesulfobacteriota bacterium]